MSEATDIGWTDSTISPWFVCTEQSPGCLNCYARELTEQKFAFVSKDNNPLKSGVIRKAYFKAGFADWATRPVWGNKATRVLSKGFWTEPLKWNRQAAKSGVRRKVFPSLMDWLDDFPAGVIDQEGIKLTGSEVLARLLGVMWLTPNIDWLLLTKRIENWKPRIEDIYTKRLLEGAAAAWLTSWREAQRGPAYGQPPKNVLLGVSVEDQKRADDRREAFKQVPAATKFVSYEPALECVCWDGWEFIDQLICGGESGKDRRPCEIHWFEKSAQWCDRNQIALFMKQDGALLPGQQGRLPFSLWNRKEIPVIQTIKPQEALL